MAADPWLRDLGRRVTGLPGTRLCFDDAQAILQAPRVPDATTPGATFGGSFHLDLEELAVGAITDGDVIRMSIALAIGSHLHETAEWLRWDGQHIFAPHSTWISEFSLIAHISTGLASDLVEEHTRLSPLPRIEHRETDDEAIRPRADGRDPFGEMHDPALLLEQLTGAPGVTYRGVGDFVTRRTQGDKEREMRTARRVLALSTADHLFESVIAAAVALEIASAARDLVFHLRWDDQPVFVEPPADELLVRLALPAARRFVCEHPRPKYSERGLDVRLSAVDEATGSSSDIHVTVR